MASTLSLLTTILGAAFALAQNTNPKNGNASPENGGAQPDFNASVPATPGSNVNSQAGGTGGGGNSYDLSTGGLVAIIVVVVIVVALGVASAVLFYVAKKRQWEVRATIRRSIKRVGSQVSLRPAMSRRQSSAGNAPKSRGSPSREGRGRDIEKGDTKEPMPLTKTKASPARKIPQASEKPPTHKVGKSIDTPPIVPDTSEAEPTSGRNWKIGGRK